MKGQGASLRLTVKEKLKVWRRVRVRCKAAIEDISHESGLCKMLEEETRRLFGIDKAYGLTVRDTFPELGLHRPAHAGWNDYWWSVWTQGGYKSRLEVCNSIIRKFEYKK